MTSEAMVSKSEGKCRGRPPGARANNAARLLDFVRSEEEVRCDSGYLGLKLGLSKGQLEIALRDLKAAGKIRVKAYHRPFSGTWLNGRTITYLGG